VPDKLCYHPFLMSRIPATATKRPRHQKRYSLLLDSWAGPEVAGGVSSNFRHVANALHERGQLHAVWVIDQHRPFWLPNELEPDVPYRVVRVSCNWGRFLRGGGRLGRVLVAALKIALSLTREHALFNRIVATNYCGLAGVYSHLPWGHRVLSRVSTTTEQVGDFETGSTPPEHPWVNRLLTTWEYRAIRSSTLQASHTISHIRWLAERLKRPINEFAYVPHGMPLGPALPHPWIAPKTLIFLGRLEHRKGCDVLMNALPQLFAAMPDVRFVLIGRDSHNYEGQLDQGFRTQHADRLIFTGLVSDEQRDRWLEECYALVSPARYESFGLTYLEAMARGKPVIGCTGSGSAEVIGGGGLVVAPGEVEPLVEAMIRLLKEQELYKKLVEGARRQTKRFDVNETVRCLDDVFASAEQELVI
jgi:glycosyltransferase involved in cell wall biosynthesis